MSHVRKADSIPRHAYRLSKRKAFKISNILRRTEVLPVEEELELDREDNVEDDEGEDEETEENTE